VDFPNRRTATMIAVSAIVLAAVAVAAFLIGESRGRSTSNYSGTITIANGNQGQGCVKPENGKEVCGAFVSALGGGSGLFVAGAKVKVEQVTVDQLTILMMSIERCSPTTKCSE
jgi:hypothetical protein